MTIKSMKLTGFMQRFSQVRHHLHKRGAGGIGDANRRPIILVIIDIISIIVNDIVIVIVIIVRHKIIIANMKQDLTRSDFHSQHKNCIIFCCKRKFQDSIKP